MRSGRQKEPEFEKRSSGQGGEPEVGGGQVDRKPLVLSRTIFEKIRMAAKVFTAEDRARQKQVQNNTFLRNYLPILFPPFH
jgi:hypothetical protein